LGCRSRPPRCFAWPSTETQPRTFRVVVHSIDRFIPLAACPREHDEKQRRCTVLLALLGCGACAHASSSTPLRPCAHKRTLPTRQVPRHALTFTRHGAARRCGCAELRRRPSCFIASSCGARRHCAKVHRGRACGGQLGVAPSRVPSHAIQPHGFVTPRMSLCKRESRFEKTHHANKTRNCPAAVLEASVCLCATNMPSLSHRGAARPPLPPCAIDCGPFWPP
jgi:hypothetical protein